MSKISKLNFSTDRCNALLIAKRKPRHKGKIILLAGTEGPWKDWKSTVLALQ